MPRSRGVKRDDWILIRTKLVPPQLPAGTIERPLLLAKLDNAGQHRITMVSAPAGYGKTTLAVQWLRTRRLDSAWLSLDAGDSDSGRFARYLISAIQEAHPRALARSAALLASPSKVPWNYFSEALAADLARLARPLWVVLDDYQVVAGAEAQGLVRELVEVLPANLHLVVLSRSDPGWPLGRWRGRGWLAELRARDLRFSSEEVHAYFGGNDRLDLPDSDLDRLAERTEGWPVGLHLARISIARAADPGEAARKLSGSNRLIVDYLLDEVLSAQPPEIRQLLAVTAPLERFCAPLCDRLLAPEGPARPAADRIEELERRGLFLVPLDSERRWFRYHHLFAQLLAHHLPEASSPESRREVLRRAGAWFAEEGLVEEALRLWIEAGEVHAAADLLGRHIGRVLDQDDAFQIFRRWLAIFPPGAETGRVPLLVAWAHEKYVRWDSAGIAAMIERAEACLAAPGDPGVARWSGLRANLDALRCFLAYWQGDAAAAIRFGDRSLANLEEGHRGWVRSLACIYRAGGLFLAGRVAEAHRFLDEQVQDVEVRSGIHLGRYLAIHGFMHLYEYDLEGVERAARRVIDTNETLPISAYWLAEAEYLLGVTALERDRLAEAAEWFQAAVRRKYMSFSRFHHESLLGLALVAERRSDLETSAAMTAAARAWALEAGDPGSILISDSFESRGRPGADAPAAGDLALGQAIDAASPWLEVPSITRCERLLRNADPKVRLSVFAAIDEAHTGFEARRNARQALRLSVLRADALLATGQREAARAVLEGALDFAAPRGIVRPFLGGAQERRDLLAALADQGRHRSLIERVLAPPLPAGGASSTAEPPRIPRDSGAPHVERPTLREQEVLELLAERLTDKEIAARLAISPEAVKKRLASLYGKLAVHGRREAVRAAIAHRLLERPAR